MNPKKILLIDDSELLHKMYEVILIRYKTSGTEILHAYDGQEALTKLHEHPDTDLMLLDINMPVMSGLEFLSIVKSEGAFKAIPVIIVTTEGKEEDTLRGLKAGARGYVKKPFQAADLQKLISRICPPDEHRRANAGV